MVGFEPPTFYRQDSVLPLDYHHSLVLMESLFNYEYNLGSNTKLLSNIQILVSAFGQLVTFNIGYYKSMLMVNDNEKLQRKFVKQLS